MDSLLQAANFDKRGDARSSTSKKRKRKRSTERGFQGTLLHSGPSAPSTNRDSSEDEQRIEAIATNATYRNDRKLTTENTKGPPTLTKPQSYTTSDSDDDIPEASPFASKQPKKASPTGGRKSEDDNNNDFHNYVVVVENTQEEPDAKADYASARPKENPSVHENVATQVLSILGGSVDQSTCWDAVEWVMKVHPGEKDQESLVEAVLNKILK